MSSSTSSNSSPFGAFKFTNPSKPPFPRANTSLTLNNISSHTHPFSMSTNTSTTTTNNNTNKRKLDAPLSFMNKRRRIDSSTTSTTKSPESMDDTSSTSNDIKYRYSIDEKVLAWYDRQLHQCKIVDRKININNILYLIHYEGWDNKWDEWVSQNKILTYTPQNIQLMKNNAGANKKQLNTKNNNHLLKKNKNKKSKEVRKKTKIKIASKSNKNKLNNNTNLSINTNTNSNASNSSLLSSSFSLNDNYEKRYYELEMKYNNLLQKQQQTENKCNKYKNIINKLYKELVEGESPRWHLIDANDKEDRVIRDKELAQLKSQIGSLYPKGHWEVGGYGQWKGKGHLEEAVSKFVTINGEYKVSAFAWLGGHIAQLNDVLQKFKIENHSRIPALNDQYGVRALLDIPRNTCVGQYFGAEILQKAFGKVYEGTSEEYDHNIYAFDQIIDTQELKKLKQKQKQMKVQRQIRYKNNSNNSNNKYENDNNDHDIVNKVFIIDPFVGDWKDNELLLRWVNDCRCDIFENIQPTKEDNKYYNVEYVGMKVNGWPQTYLVTKRDIKKGEELMTYYGEKFADAIQEQMTQKNEKKRQRIGLIEIL